MPVPVDIARIVAAFAIRRQPWPGRSGSRRRRAHACAQVTLFCLVALRRRLGSVEIGRE